jgi:hypothetical protein
VCDNLTADDVDTTDKEHPFLCMDLTFIYALFSKGYNLPDDKDVNVTRKDALFTK